MSVFHKEKGWASSTGTVRRRLRFARCSGSADTPAASSEDALVSRRGAALHQIVFELVEEGFFGGAAALGQCGA